MKKSAAISIVQVPVTQVKPSRFQPRTVFREDALAELAASIKRHGVQQPVVVLPRRAGHWELIAGERRWRAATLAGLSTIPAVMRDVTDAEAAELALIENLQRTDLDALEEAEAYHRLIEGGLAVEVLAQRISKTVGYVKYRLVLRGLEPSVKAALRANQINLGQSHSLSRLTQAGQRAALAQLVATGEVASRKLHRFVSAWLEREAQPEMFQLTDQKIAGDREIIRRFESQLDAAAAALASCFKKGEPVVLEWVLAEDVAASIPKIKALRSTVTEMLLQVQRARARRMAAGLRTETDYTGRRR